MEQEILEESRKKLEEAQLRVVNVYLSAIRDDYISSSSEYKKLTILKGLERVACIANRPDIDDDPISPEEARRIRKSVGLLQTDMPGSCYLVVGKYERGENIPKHHLPALKLYFEFLRQLKNSSGQ